jgi:putative colanic acid biosynthesis acetyltransferase WcaF
MNDELPRKLYSNELSKSNKLARLIWSLVWLLFFRLTPRWTLNGWRLFLLRCFGAKIGIGCRVLPSCKIWAPWNLTMGCYSVLGEGVDCYTMDKISIGNYTTVSQRSFLCGGTHDIAYKSIPLVTLPINIGDYCWVCAEAFIGPGITLSDYSVVAARAVVLKNVGTREVVGGNPAKFIKFRTLVDVDK